VFSRKPNVFTCQHCTREFAHVTEFVHHLTARKHFPNKLRKKKSLAVNTATPSGPQVTVSNSAGSATLPRLPPLDRAAARRGISPNRLPTLLLPKLRPPIDSADDYDGGDSDRRVYNSTTDVNGDGMSAPGFTCNQCNLSFDLFSECARHMAKSGHTKTTAAASYLALQPRVPLRRLSSDSVPRGRPRSLVVPLKGTRRSMELQANSRCDDPIRKGFTYECRCCSFATAEVETLFAAGAALGHKCVAAEENNSTAFLLMCAVCRVLLLDKIAVESHRYGNVPL